MMVKLSLPVQTLIRRYENARTAAQPEKGVSTVHVDEIAARVAAFYERLRGIVDWREEHLIRRGAIERVLKRKFFPELSGFSVAAVLDAKELAEPLVAELVRGGHFPNDSIPEEKIFDIQRILEKYIYILRNNPLSGSRVTRPKEWVNFYSWLLEISACEIEETLDPPIREYALVECMTSLMVERIRLGPNTNLTDEEKKIQTYIAAHRALFHLDWPVVSYHLLLYRCPEWAAPSEALQVEIAQNILSIREDLEKTLKHPLANKFYAVCERFAPLYLILGDILKRFADEPSKLRELLAEPKALENLARDCYNLRLATLKTRLFRMAVFSTLSIFTSSGFSLFVVEVPLAALFYGRFSPFAMAVDILVPTLFMFLLVALIRPPRASNMERVIAGVKSIAYQEGVQEFSEIRTPKRRGLLTRIIIGLLYFVECFVSLGAVAWIFYAVRIPWTSIILDTLNVAVVAFAGMIIRGRSRELTIESEKPSFWRFAFDVLTLPVAKVGGWISAKWREYNILSVFFTALFDMPFKVFIDLIESWSAFLKEQKEAIH